MRSVPDFQGYSGILLEGLITYQALMPPLLSLLVYVFDVFRPSST